MNDRDETRGGVPAAGGTRGEHERFREWDAAYLLGALTPGDRHAYEDHLASCPLCSAAVGELAGLPALLGTLSAADAMALLDADAEQGAEAVFAGAADPLAVGSGVEAPDSAPDLVPALLHRVRRIRRIRRWSFAGAVVAAAAVAAAVALVLPGALAAPGAPGTPGASSTPVGGAVTVALRAPGASPGSHPPLTADVTLARRDWGTSVGMVCSWDARSSWTPYPGQTTRWDYGLWIVTSTGRTERVASWWAGPGDVVRTTDSTDAPLASIERLEVRSADGKKVLLAADVPGADAPTR